jgi:hypothetical protein
VPISAVMPQSSGEKATALVLIRPEISSVPMNALKRLSLNLNAIAAMTPKVHFLTRALLNIAAEGN